MRSEIAKIILNKTLKVIKSKAKKYVNNLLNMKKRKFEVVEGFENKVHKMPCRATKFSAGYDFFALENITILPIQLKTINIVNENGIPEYNRYLDAKPILVQTGIKVLMPDNEFLQLQIRSSLGKKGLQIVNSPGIIDSDYYNNEKTKGQIIGMFINLSCEQITIKKGDHFMQGIFQKYYITDNDNSIEERKGGFGSTNK